MNEAWRVCGRQWRAGGWRRVVPCAAWVAWAAVFGSGCQAGGGDSLGGDGGARAIAAARHVAVHLFVTEDCPISNAYAPELARLMERYQPRGVTFLLVYVDPAMSHVGAQRHANEYGLDCAVIVDAGHELVRRAGATVTPEAAVYVGRAETSDPVYVGRIDNLYVEPGSRRSKATTHELAEAIEAALAGRPVAVGRTEAVGCPIADMR